MIHMVLCGLDNLRVPDAHMPGAAVSLAGCAGSGSLGNLELHFKFRDCPKVCISPSLRPEVHGSWGFEL